MNFDERGTERGVRAPEASAIADSDAVVKVADARMNEGRCAPKANGLDPFYTQ